MISVRIRECKTNGREWTHNARTDDHDIAIGRTIKKHWGTRAFFWQDSGLQKGYGQITKTTTNGINRSVTGRIRITTEEIAERRTSYLSKPRGPKQTLAERPERCSDCGGPVRECASKKEKTRNGKSNPNFGRKYVTCNRRGCGFFAWIEPSKGRPPSHGAHACPKCGQATYMSASKRSHITRNGKRIKNPNFGRQYRSCSAGACEYFEWMPKGKPATADPLDEPAVTTEAKFERDEPKEATFVRVVSDKREREKKAWPKCSDCGGELLSDQTCPKCANEPAGSSLDAARAMFARP